jgi:diguanylate cyclase (GGDEF)-like protein
MHGQVVKSFKWLSAAGILVAAGMLFLGGFVLLSARKDAWVQAQQDLNNLSVSLEREISRNIAVYDLSLQGARKALQLPGLKDVSPEIRQMALFDQAASADGLGSLLVLDRNGRVVGDSTALTPHPLSLSDRDYFTVHKAKPDVGLYVSAPFRSRLRGGDPSISISRRINDTDGQFDGVVVGTIRLTYFNSLFSRLNLGADGSIALFRTDGRLVARSPKRDDDIGRILGTRSQAQEFLRTGQTEMVGQSELDGVERFTVFRPIGVLPLVVAVSESTATILAPWSHRSIVIAAALGILSFAVVTLSWLFSRELQSRVRAEAKAILLAEQLSAMATTDGLTGLANRRAFDERLAIEWRRSTRNQTSLAVMMIDADQFKLFNDRYGHLAGDCVLTAIADCMLMLTRRPGDLCARFGGEEFVILLPETELVGARTIAEAIRSAILALAMPHADSLLGVVSVSVGVAVSYPIVDESSANLVNRADAMLYEAKRAGRNRVVTVPIDESRFDRRIPQPG